MNIAEKLRTSRGLMKSALQVLRRHPKLWLFPVASSGFAVVMAVFFLAPVVWLLFSEEWWMPTDWVEVGGQARRLTKETVFDHFVGDMAGGFYAYGALIYLFSMVSAVFFNVAFYHEIMRALAGNAVSLRGGLRFAWSRGSAILRWSLLAGTVGLVIRAIEERLGWVGRLIMGLLGTAWSVAAVFAIPVIVRREEKNPMAVLRDSAATLKRTWGESVAGFIGIQVAGALVIFGTLFLVVGVAFLAVWTRQAWMVGIAIPVWLLGVIALGVFLSMATHIYRCALYIYASEGVVPEPYSRELMDAAWKVKKAKAS